MITITAYDWVPPIVQGLVRDLRVRWALEEAGLPYRVELIDLQNKPAEYKDWQPWSQVPAYEEDGLRMFESGAIVQHIAEKSPVLSPADPAAKIRMTCWLFAALNSVEPPLQELALLDFMHKDKDWAKERRPALVEWVQARFRGLASAMGAGDFLDGGFTAADLMMATVLRMAKGKGLLEEAGLDSYLARCEARPAFQRALDGQMADFKDAA
jgi:glutathione S-transferase